MAAATSAWEIALPVQSFPDAYDGVFHLKRTEAFKCVIGTHFGTWADLPATYDRIMEFVSRNALQVSQRNREIQINFDICNPAANVTWVQVGVA